MAEKSLNFDDVKNEEYIYCKYCNNSMKRKHLKKHLKKKCKRYKAFLNKKPKKVEDIDMSEMKDFDRLEQLYITLFLDEDRLSMVKYQELKNNIKRLEVYFSKEEILEINKKAQTQIKITSTYCEKCNKDFKNLYSLDHHIASKKHKYDWEEYFCRDEVKNRLREKKLVHNHEIGHLVKETRNTIVETKSKTEKIKVDNVLVKEVIEKKVISTNKDKEQDNPILKEQILKHKSEIEQYDEDINDELLTDEELYYENIRTKLEYNIRNYNEVDKQKILKQYVYTTKKSAIDITLRNEIRSYLYKIYRGYCQICGFTFRKPRDGENSFEMHNWDNKLVVKTKSYLVSSADSLCLCRNCSANIKFGAFNPLFMDKVHSLDNFNDKILEEVKEFICTKIDRKIVVERFKELYEWEDIYALEITLNDEPKNIYMTNGHLIQFIAYLQLEEKVND